jgi:molybdenum cofactor synthesis domain-containing protein
MVNAEILAIGDELCYGRVYDTNSFWLADQVTRLGVMVRRIICVRDDEEELIIVLKEMLNRKPRFIFMTGGLGPTEDDKTIETLSRLTGRKVIVEQNILKDMVERRNLNPSQVSTSHRRMSSTLDGAECRRNLVGWAPLTIIRLGETKIFAMPGPPKEMQSCFTTYLVKEIEDITHYHSIAKRVVVTMFEPELATLVNQIQKSIAGVYLKPLVSESIPNIGLPVEIIVFDADEQSCQRKYVETLEMLRESVNEKGREIREG